MRGVPQSRLPQIDIDLRADFSMAFSPKWRFFVMCVEYDALDRFVLEDLFVL